MMNHKSGKFIELILSILKRPGMFGVSKVEDLNYIIMGYMFSQNDDEVCGIMDRFKVCANKKFDNDNTDWARLIRFYSASDSHSLELFKIVLDEMLDGDLN